MRKGGGLEEGGRNIHPDRAPADLGCNLVHLDTVSATMKLLIVILHLVGFCFFTTSSARLRREGVGQQPEMDDILKVAQHAHQAADIYFEERKSLPEGRSGRDVFSFPK